MDLIYEASKYLGLLVFPIFAYILIKKRRKSEIDYEEFIAKIKPAGIFYIVFTLLVMIPMCLFVIVLALQGTIAFIDMLFALCLFLLLISFPILLFTFLYKRKPKNEKTLE